MRGVLTWHAAYHIQEVCVVGGMSRPEAMQCMLNAVASTCREHETGHVLQSALERLGEALVAHAAPLNYLVDLVGLKKAVAAHDRGPPGSPQCICDLSVTQVEGRSSASQAPRVLASSPTTLQVSKSTQIHIWELRAAELMS